MDINTIYNTIRKKGGRLTKTRKAIIHTLVHTHCLMSQTDIRSALAKQSMKPDRSTLFRELLFLAKHAIVLKNTISGTDYYEIPHDHHHHLVCLGCNAIKKVEFGNHLTKQEKQISQRNHFTIMNHSLEFYGYCHKCQAHG